MLARPGRVRDGPAAGPARPLPHRHDFPLRHHHRIHDLFEVIVNSARVGVAKPDARIYHHAAKAIGLDPSACLHIDDLPHNIAGAQAAGFQAVHYNGDFAALERDLRAAGLGW